MTLSHLTEKDQMGRSGSRLYWLVPGFTLGSGWKLEVEVSGSLESWAGTHIFTGQWRHQLPGPSDKTVERDLTPAVG